MNVILISLSLMMIDGSCGTAAALSCYRLRRFAWRRIEPMVSTVRASIA